MSGSPSSILQWQFVHDESGRLKRLSLPGGKETLFSYTFFPDEIDQIKTVARRFSGGEVTYEYDRRGRRTAVTDQTGSIHYEWDQFGQISSVRRSIGPGIEYRYDSLRRLKGYRAGSDFDVEYVYDFLSRIEAIKTPVGAIRYEYWTGQGKTIRILPNGISTIWDHEPDGRLAAITHVDPNDYRIAKFSYSYRPDGLIEQILEWSPREERQLSFEYDAVQRLAAVSDSAGKSWRGIYDGLGNRTTEIFGDGHVVEYRHDWAGRLTSVSGAACTHDDGGNLSAVRLDGGLRRFEFDHHNRICRANQGEVHYEHDGDGCLVTRTCRGERATYIPDPLSDGWHPLVELLPVGRQRFYLWEDRSPLVVVENGTATFFLHDRIGSVRCVAEGAGKVVERRDYSVFGVFEGLRADSDLVPGFAGLFWDPAASVYLSRARAYSPNLGRFLQMDSQHRLPLGSQKDLSAYVYCGNDPVNWADTTGLAPDCKSNGEGMTIGTLFNPDTAQDWYKNQAARADASGHWIGGSLLDLAGRVVGLSKYADTAETWYADQAARADASGNWIGASVLDILGGFIGGDKTQGQALAGIGFSFLPTVRAGMIKSVGSAIGRFTGVSGFVQNVEGGDYLHALFGAAALGAGKLFDESDAALEAMSQSIHGAQVAAAMRMPGLANQWLQIGSRQASRAIMLHAMAYPLAIPDLASHVSKALGLEPAHALSPSPVGGVYLGGAGALLEGLGQVTGIATDHETGTLILLTEQAGSFRLPPLRIDDVVTVFRSVYLYGEGPSVTIDPRPDDPHGPWMDVVHGAATADTYVGWVLFEADRIMKAYNLGEDNLSRTPVSSAVAGYDDVLSTIYFGGDFGDGKKAEGNWERFLIVPAEVSCFHASSKELTLFDVPLKVKTQRMVLNGGKLEDDPMGRSSKGALAFVEWFTRTYEGIAREQYLQPPLETGSHAAVPIFSELRRIALISAVAEQLRDRGTPMPFWMKDYEVKRIPVPNSTPAMTVTRTVTTDKRIVTGSIYGGVNLSPADEAVKQFDRDSDLKRLSPSQREACTRQVPAAEDLAPAVISAVKAKPMLVPISVQRGDRQVEAVALPGSESKALAPCRLEEVDLVVRVQGGGQLALVRQFNSFFQPNGPWGRGWTTDWPHLDEVKMPLKRTDKGVRFRLVHELNTPLNRIHARFSETRQVAELNAKLLVPDKKCEVLALAGANDALVKQGKTEVVFRDGRIWFFDEKGNFVGEQAKPFTTIYLRDSAGRVEQMIGFDGGQTRAVFRLGYDAKSRLESAQSDSDGERIVYQYGSDGMLQSVTSAEGKTSYTYDGGLVKSISWSARIDGERFEDPVPQQEFEYAPNGQMLTERAADGSRTSYAVEMQNGRYRMAITTEDGSHGTVAEYDERLRPLAVTDADNTRTQWAYEADGGVKTATTLPNGEVTKISLSADGKHHVTETSDNVRVGEDRDEGGRLTNLSINQRPILQQEWHPNGLLKSMSCETHKVIPQYDEHGRLQSALRVKPAEGDKFSLWQETQFDDSGRLKAVKDHTGSDVEVRYDSRGDVAGLVTKRDGKDFGISIKRNPAGQIELLNSSSGEEKRRYDANGSLEEVVVKRGPSTANAEFSHGRVASLTQFDGGRVQFAYHPDGEEEGRLKSVQTPAVTLNYHYSPDGTISGVDLGETCRINYEHDTHGNLVRLALEPRRD